ncbi:MAG: hypothetical protein AB7E47_10320 [Desulfovibrionaceae bacterium]
MPKQSFYVLSFQDTQPEWGFFDGAAIVPASMPDTASKAPVLALVPDSHFFFFQAKGGGENDRNIKAAAKLQMQHLFPAVEQNQENGTVKTNGSLLGFYSHPRFMAFWEEHEALFARATVVTTPFFLAWSVAKAQKLPQWQWGGNGAPRALYAHDELYYFMGDDGELARRSAALELDAPPPPLELATVLAGLDAAQIKLPKLRLPLRHISSAQVGDPRAWVRAFILLGLVGVLFCAGALWRWHGLSQQATQWKAAVGAQYARALGDDLGPDPFGKLLFRLDQVRGTQVSGIDMRELLVLLSRAATDSFAVDSLSLNRDTGTIRARIASYDELEKMMQGLGGDPRFAFTLEQASNTDNGVALIFRVAFAR